MIAALYTSLVRSKSFVSISSKAAYCSQRYCQSACLCVLEWTVTYDISAPVPLLRSRGHIRHGPLVHLPHASGLDILAVLLICAVCVFLETGKREPSVIVGAIVRQFLFVLDTSLAENRQLYAGAVAI